MDLVVEQGHGISCRILKSNANLKWGFGVPGFLMKHSHILSASEAVQEGTVQIS